MCAAVGPAGDYSNVSGMSFSAAGEALGLDRTSVKAYAERRSLVDCAAHLTAAEALEASLFSHSRRKKRSNAGFDAAALRAAP